MSVDPDSNEQRPQGDSIPAAAAPEPAPAPLEAQTPVEATSWVEAALVAMGAALVAGFLAWGIGEQAYDYYRPSAAARTSRDFTALNREKRISDQKNTAIVFGTFGALMGLLSGAAGGGLKRSIPSGTTAALMGLLMGGIGAAMVSYGLAPIYGRFYSYENPSLVLSWLVRGGIWGVVGLTAGLALGWGWQGPLGISRTLTGGLAGSICGTTVFEMVNALLFPDDQNDAVIPNSMETRLLAFLFVAVGVAIGAVFFGRQSASAAGRTSQVHS